ncbi:nuclear transport factor 2 family protein [Hylemonella gracilis]|uniref:SnoaL-like domain-containing protein n=1 Tax=Hylemonella gracilis ATCC 19624 TaxID=887062 RepID=F3KU34_9BURK|nr:nuclear transport factor 2 family protein [Hylemonella gracilis]EGI76717.1 hypothetical protein HGR_09830 [Hylemonella gracilis ATCC 19624]
MRTAYEIVANHYAASARGDVASMMKEVSPEVRWTEMAGFPCAGTYIGPEQVIEHVFQVLGRDWEGYRFELETLIDGGNEHVVGVGTYHGTHRLTGKSMSARVAHVWRVKNSLISEFEQFTDTLLVADAVR